MDVERTKRVLIRGLKLRCPSCGEGAIFCALIKTHERCPVCGLLFLREQGYFIGSVYVNVIVTEGLIMLVYLASVLLFSGGGKWILTVLLVLAVAFPLLFFRHARSLWLSFDYLFDPADKQP